MEWPVRRIARQQRSEDIWTEKLAHGKGAVSHAGQVDTCRSISSVQVATNKG
jgi:hypothetical protein